MKVKRLLLALSLSLLVGKSFAISFKVDGINYVANADTAIIKGYSEIPENGELTLASTVSYGGKDYRVTTVQKSAFLACTDIKKLIVPASIKYIQSGAFENCINMSNLVLEDGDDRLDAEVDAFKNCGIEETTIGRNLKNSIFKKNATLVKVSFGNEIRVIPDQGFYCCANLADVKLNHVESIGSQAFSECPKIKNIDLNGVKKIASSSFWETGLEKIEIPSSLQTMGSGVFAYCSSLKKVTFSCKLTIIPDYSFEGCSSLSDIDYPSTITTIGESAFRSCAFTSFDFKPSVMEIKKEAFSCCRHLKNVNWGNIAIIGNAAFQDSGIEALILPSSLQQINAYAFSDCSNLKNADLSNTKVKAVGCFSNCKALKEVLLPQGLEAIGYQCFDGCSSLEQLSIPQSVKQLSGKDFANMISLKTMDLSKTKLTNISQYCFAQCSSLESILLPNTIQGIDSYAFENVSKLQQVDLSNTQVNLLSNYCFKGCSSLKEISLSSKTDTICVGAFVDCTNLSVVKNTDKINMVYDNAFENTKIFDSVHDAPAIIGSVLYSYKGSIAEKEYIVPEGITCISAKAFKGQKIQAIKLNNGLKYIGNNAFSECSSLLSLTVPSSVEVIEDGYGYSSLTTLTLREGEDDLCLGKFSDSKIKKFYMGRNLSCSVDWMSELEDLTIGKYVKTIGSDFSSSKKLTNLELEDADSSLDFGMNPMVSRITSLYMGRNIKVGTYEGKDEYANWDLQVTRGNSFLALSDLTVGEKVTSICDYFCEYNWLT